jgi:hypothetical protein
MRSAGVGSDREPRTEAALAIPQPRRPIIEVRPESAAPMSEHKFKIGQWVSYGPPGQRKIVYTIVQRLPSEGGGEPRYRIKAADEPHERIVGEAELRDASGREMNPELP